MPLLHTPRSPVWILTAMLAISLAAGCGTHTGHATADGAAAMNAATTPDTIAQTSWTLIRWTSAQGQTRPVQPPLQQGQAADAMGRPITLDFLARGDDYRVGGYSGCNAYQGRYALAHGELAITVPAATRMACSSPPAAALERNFLNALATIKVFRLDNGGAPHAMTLMLDDGDTLAFARGEDPPIR